MSPDCEVFSEVRFSLQYEGQQIPLQFMDHENCICNNGIKDFMEVKLEKMVTKSCRQDLGNSFKKIQNLTLLLSVRRWSTSAKIR